MGNRYQVEYLNSFLNSVFAKAGVKKEIAGLMTDTLIHGELRGVSSHGIIRVEAYLKRMEAGVLECNAEPTIVSDSGAAILMDANYGFGQWACYKAMLLGIERARKYGVCAIGIRKSNHYGEAAYFAEMASNIGMIGINVSSCSPAIAPYGAKEAVFGTNPIAMAVPTSEEAIVLDMATTVIAKGKLRLAALAGQQIPIGWALDKDGHQTTDPTEALAGTLEAIGGPKGCALSAMIDVLSGQLTDSAKAGEVKNITDVSGPANNGQFLLVIDPASFIPQGKFISNMDDFRKKYKSLTPVKNEVMLPGEIEYGKMQENLKNGIVLKDGTVDALRRVAEKYEVEFKAGAEAI